MISFQEHDFAAGDFDGERELYEQGFVRPNVALIGASN